MVDTALDASNSRRRRRTAQVVQIPTPQPPPSRMKIETIAVIVALAVQAGGAVWWSSGVNSRLAVVEKSVTPLQDGAMHEQLGTLVERSKQQGDDIAEVKTWVRRISDRLEAIRFRHSAD